MENISYAKTVYGQEEIDAVVKCLNESTQMGNYARQFETEIFSIVYLFKFKLNCLICSKVNVYILLLSP